MTNQEFKNEFLIAYNAIASMSAPGLDDYEISVYLTKAQLEIIKNYYDPDSNRKQKGFENSEKRRVDLNTLVNDYKTFSNFTDNRKINELSKFYIIPDNVFLIINEKLKIISDDCNNGKIIEILPISHDKFNKQIKNPFKKPSDKIAWRLDIFNIENDKVVEIVSTIENTLEYQLRYIKYPNPIIITNLSLTFPSDNLSIDGISQESECELNKEVHREILDRAVELALADYKPSGLQLKAQMNTRNE